MELIFMILVFGLLTLGIHPLKEQMHRKLINKFNLFTILGLESIIFGIIGVIIVIITLFTTDTSLTKIITEVKLLSFVDIGIIIGASLVVLFLAYMTLYFIKYDKENIIQLMVILETIGVLFFAY